MSDPIEELLGRSVSRLEVWSPPPPSEVELLLAQIPPRSLESGIDVYFGAPVSSLVGTYRRYQGIIGAALGPDKTPELRGQLWCWPPAAGILRRSEVYAGEDINLAAEAVNKEIGMAVRRGLVPEHGASPMIKPAEALSRLRALIERKSGI